MIEILKIGYNKMECVGSGTIYGVNLFAFIWFLIGISSVLISVWLIRKLNQNKKSKGEK